MKPNHTRVDLVHVTTVHRALDTRIFYREARTAEKAGLRVAVVGPHDKAETFEGVQIVPIQKSRSRLVRRLVAPFNAIREITRLRPRIIHFHDPEFIGAAMILKALGYRLVWDVHEYYSEVQTAHMKPGPMHGVKRALISLLVEKGPCAFFDRSVFPTEALRSAVWNSPRSIACVNLLPVDEFPGDETGTEKEYDIVFVGSMSPFRAKFFLEVVELLRERRPGFRAALIGIPEATRVWMLENAPSPQSVDAMAFLPRVPHAQVAALLRRARIGFNYHPMQRRFQVALPMKVYEYMACGIPVVCSRFPELAEQLREGEMLFVEGDNPVDYADAIDGLLSDPESLERVGRRGNEAVRNRLNWEQSEAPKLLAMYRGLLA